MITKTNFNLAAICFGVTTVFFLNSVYNIYISIAGGIVAAIIFALFFKWFFDQNRLIRQAALIDMKDQELLLESVANHLLKREAVGGKLYLLTNELVFKSHRFNFKCHTQTISLKQIKEVNLYSSRYIVDNGLVITTHDGKQEKFVVFDRYLWKVMIEKQISGGGVAIQQ